MAPGQLTARLLGGAALSLDPGGPVHPPTRKALALIAYLSLEGRATRAHLAGLLWSEFYDDTARKNLRQELHRLAGTPLGAHLALSAEDVGLREEVETDVDGFRRLARQGALEAALGVYGGPLLAGLELRGAEGFDEWLQARREALAAERLALLERLRGAREAAGDLRGALAAGLTLIAGDEFQERHHRAAMRLHLALGEREAALLAFERCRAMLEREFGLEPLPETQALAEEVRRRAAPVPPAPPAVPGLEAPLVGREAAWAAIERAWDAGRAVLLSGESGVGKSRLLREVAGARGRVLLIRGQPFDAGVPFATLARGVREELEREGDLALPERVRRELARLVPALGEPPPGPLRSGEDRLRLFDAYAEYLEAALARYDVLASDDFQFFDASSAELSLYAAARLRGRGPGRPTIAALRRDELRPEAALPLEALARGGIVEVIDLAPLSEAEVTDLIARLSGRPAVLFPRRLHAATGGNAYFVLETLRGLFEAGELRGEPGGGWATPYDDVTEDYREVPLPRSVRQAVLARADRLGAAARRLLEVGSLAGEPFTLETVAPASALAEWEALEALEGATAAQLLREEEGGYRFVHDLARRALAGAQGPERRRLVHRRLAGQLEAGGGPPAAVAAHLEQAGRPAEAAAAWTRAAADAGAVYALREALAHLGRALDALPQGAPEHFELRARREALARELGERGVQGEDLDAMAALARGDAQRLTVALRRSNYLSITGHPRGALEAAELAHALAREGGTPQEQGEALIRLASALYYVEDFARALVHVTAALGLAPALGPVGHVRALNLRGMLHTDLGDPEAALADYAAALGAWRAEGDPLSRAKIHNNRAMVLSLHGAFAAALGEADSALDLVARHGLRQLEGFVLDTRARALRGLGRLAEAGTDVEAAVNLGRRTGNHRMVSDCLHHRALLLGDLGQFEAALSAADEALEWASSTGSASNRILTLAARAGAWLALGNVPRALADARQAEALRAQGGLREALPEGVQLVLGQALRASGERDEAEAVLGAARASLRARLERLRDPGLRDALTALPLWRALFA